MHNITRGLARVDAGLDDCLTMGNLDSLRDWGHARDMRSAGAPPGVSTLLCSPYRTGKQAVEGLGLPLPRGDSAGAMHWASGCPRKLTPPALSRAAAASPLTPVSDPKLSVRPRV